MAVKSSGTLSFDTDIVGEFKGTRPHSLSEYYSGGTLVPAGTKNGAGTAIPSSGTIKFSDFYGAAARFVPPLAPTPGLYSGDYTIAQDGADYVMTLKSSGTFGVDWTGTVIPKQILLVGGGGGGGSGGGGRGQDGGAGGGGGFLEILTGITFGIASGTSATIGAGGRGNSFGSPHAGAKGGSSILGPYKVGGGGGGGSWHGTGAGELDGSPDGGSGGGGVNSVGHSTAVAPVLGHDSASSGPYGGAPGGGAGSAGTTSPMRGGRGAPSSITGTQVYYAGGGSGQATDDSYARESGAGGGYAHTSGIGAGTGLPNRGGGGVGASTGGSGSSGGSGVIIIRF